MTLSVRGIVKLFRLVKREKELHQEVQGFSVSHDHCSVRIYGHYPVIDGEETTYYRHTIHKFDFTALDGKEKWTCYRFIVSVYGDWAPSHFKKLCAAIDELPEFKPEELQQSEQSLSEATTGLSQEIGAVGLGSSFTSQLEEEFKAQNQEFKEYKSQDIQGKCSYFTWDKSKVDRRWRAAREKWPIFDGGLSQFCARWFHDMHGHPSSGLPKTI
ncbi:predicted protein [Histoplasma mississippiense (nom. inval.)]|uniref:predicted protein n=1 Tax=Ajellomyces capsulatus (strain NAm1 / WU24) TaxID=2059318 RepID=UPI000157C85D|nr:predicted protein [Histoplasma mississippiense (nom. inval.)]EDN09610.1 predicted protein [Histoplasma mississippiense (nom. inval.)]